MKIRIPNPETQINVLKRYLHILALLQNNRDPLDWNASTMADLLSRDEGEDPLSDKAVRDYIKKNLIGELGLDVSKIKGGRRTELAKPLEVRLHERIAAIYSAFVVKDISREVILKRLIKKHPDTALWLLARIYFASVTRRAVSFAYVSNTSKRRITYTVHPYHLVFRNNNLYLVALNTYNGIVSLFIVNKITGLKVLDTPFPEEIPRSAEIFKDTLGSFIGKKFNVKIRFTEKVLSQVEQVIGILEPKINETKKGEEYEASFTVSDDIYLCKQLFSYGDQVEILEPPDLRSLMRNMLEESLSVYR